MSFILIRNTRLLRAIPLTLIMLLSSLHAMAQQGAQVTVTGGVREIIYTDPTPPQTDPYLIELSTIYGKGQGEDTFLLARPFPHEVTDDGTLYVVDVRLTKAHWFSKEGIHLGEFGSKGEGPGEFPNVMQDLILDSDRIYINDPFASRMNIFDLSGQFIESIPYSPTTVSSPHIALYGPKEDRHYLVFRPLQRRELNDGWFRIVRHNERLELIDTPVDSSVVLESIQIGRSDVIVPLFENYLPECAIGTDMPAAWSYGDEFRIDFLDAVDLSRWAVTIPHDPLPVTRRMREDMIVRYAPSESEEAARNKLRFAKILPHIQRGGMHWDTTGRLWVQEYRDRAIEDSPFRFYVFARDGTWLFRQDLPKQPWLITEEGFYGRGEDPEGNPVIELYRFIDR